jgi:hypothetical protein
MAATPSGQIFLFGGVFVTASQRLWLYALFLFWGFVFRRHY